MTEHAGIRKIAFTGSGRRQRIMASAAGNLKRLTPSSAATMPASCSTTSIPRDRRPLLGQVLQLRAGLRGAESLYVHRSAYRKVATSL
jgi:hypothetical protein